MPPSLLEKRISRISTGRLPSSRLLELSSRPFVHQACCVTLFTMVAIHVDVVFPSDHELREAFSKLETEYYTSRGPLAEIYESLRAYGQGAGRESDAQVASSSKFLPDAWSCKEGSFALSSRKETYEALGLPGTKLSTLMPGAPDQHHKGTGPLSPSRAQYFKVEPVIHILQNVHVPTSALPPRPHLRSTSARRREHRDLSPGERATNADDNDALQDWNERASSLFEWIGMVNVGAQRLQANDRVDPYVAVYSAPAPSAVGDVVHVQWRGFLTPRFVQRVLDTAITYPCRTLLARRLMAASSSIALIGLTIHGSTAVPILTPHRMPRLEGEDTASIILAPDGDAMTRTSASAGDEDSLTGGQTLTGTQLVRWAVVETIGRWDSRFG
ncbi:ribonuclease P 40kDa subunit-domain-containing protein [Russula earlei]|uniref:Ribonuclease P 40kDa subunit-domain-containing protein n=1 Tax=Russula earlei TaxID=71964 RepID=A0ACC0U263_9AGAM|nr:ribonuclease P 40kDa subunit-domain-containing protein [Russula earlei]